MNGYSFPPSAVPKQKKDPKKRRFTGNSLVTADSNPNKTNPKSNGYYELLKYGITHLNSTFKVILFQYITSLISKPYDGIYIAGIRG